MSSCVCWRHAGLHDCANRILRVCPGLCCTLRTLYLHARCASSLVRDPPRKRGRKATAMALPAPAAGVKRAVSRAPFLWVLPTSPCCCRLASPPFPLCRVSTWHRRSRVLHAHAVATGSAQAVASPRHKTNKTKQIGILIIEASSLDGSGSPAPLKA